MQYQHSLDLLGMLECNTVVHIQLTYKKEEQNHKTMTFILVEMLTMFPSKHKSNLFAIMQQFGP